MPTYSLRLPYIFSVKPINGWSCTINHFGNIYTILGHFPFQPNHKSAFSLYLLPTKVAILAASLIIVDKIPQIFILEVILVHITRTNVNNLEDLANKLFSADLLNPYENWHLEK